MIRGEVVSSLCCSYVRTVELHVLLAIAEVKVASRLLRQQA